MSTEGANRKGIMRLGDLRIDTQITLGLGAILASVVLLGAVAWMQNESLWQETQGLYDHPFAVSRALGEFKADVLAMQRDMKDLAYAESDAERLLIIQSIDASEARALRGLSIAYERFLGPRSQVDDVERLFAQWKAIRNDTLLALRSGRAAEARRNVRADGAGGAHVGALLHELEHVDQFARDRADTFFREATKKKSGLLLRLGILFSVVFLLCLGVGYLLLRGIREPLRELASVTSQYRRGRLDVRSAHVSANEMGTLAAAFNQMAETLQHDIQNRENAARIAEVMLREEEMHPFCHGLLVALLECTGSQLGAVYVLNAAKTDYELVESMGMGAAGHASFSATGGEGEFSAVLATRRIQRITDIPADTAFIFPTSGGDFRPREILTIPITAGQDVAAVISLASLRSYSRQAFELVDGCLGMMTARLNGVLAVQQVRAFSARLERQNQELEEQKRELAVQADELTEQNIELEMQKRQLAEASSMKSRFLSNMSHELRTPLNSVIALSGVLGRRLRGTVPEEEYGYLDVIERNGRQLLALINDILDLARIESGREELSIGSFSVTELAAEVAAVLEPLAREKGIALLNGVEAGLPPMRSDFAKCRHVLQNIAGNAVKFTERGKVEITASHHDGEMFITVSDTGIGIAAEQIPRIFDEFSQGDESSSKKYGGTGLGLNIANKYAVLLGGSISVESEPGAGSTFTVRLPLAIGDTGGGAGASHRGGDLAPAGARFPDVARPATPRPGFGKSVLLVEDSEPAIVQVTDILQEQGYSVRVARNGKEALARVGEVVPDAMILDLMMPEVDGFEVLRAVRASQSTAQMPVLILTAKHVSKEELSFLKGNNIHELVQKGDVSRTGLLDAIGKMVTPRPQNHTPAPARGTPAGKPVILVVEDNPDNMRTVRALLREVAILTEATDGPSGIEQARTQLPNLILLDISLPGKDGFRTLDEIRQDERLRHIPVIALTARAMRGDREEILAYGFDGYVSKPVDDAALHQSICEALNGN